MQSRRTAARAAAVATGLAIAVGSLAACSGGDDESKGGEGGKVELSWLVPADDQTVPMAEALVDGFNDKNPDITIKLETHPAGVEGDNAVKTRLATGEMNDIFYYNSGALMQAFAPDKTLVDLSDQAWVGDLSDNFKRVVSTDAGLYGVPMGTSYAGGVLYNKDVYADLGLEIPTSWDEFIANNDKIKAAGITPVLQSLGESWTGQVPVLADFANVLQADPEWADKYTGNKAKYADAPALASFEHSQELYEKGYFNEDFASATINDVLVELAEGTGAQYIMLSAGGLNGLTQVAPEAIDHIGIFALPAEDAANTAITTWEPNASYIPKTTTGAKLDASLKFFDFINSADGCAIQNEFFTAAGPFSLTTCEVAEGAAPMVADIQKYVEDGKAAPALEFLSPVKGPNLPNIMVEVLSGITSGEEGAKAYDDDVKAQAQQLNLEGW